MSSRPDDEVDFGRYWAALVARWWLLLAGLLAGGLVGYLTASGSKQVNRASVTIYLGQPLGATGSAPIQTLQTNPSTVRTVIHSAEAIAKAAAAGGVAPADFRDGISSAPVAGFIAKLNQTPLVAISVTADIPPAAGRKVVSSLAQSALAAVSGFVDAKTAAYRAQIAQDTTELASIDARLTATSKEVTGGSLSSTDKLVLLNLQSLAQQRRTNVLSDQLQAKQLLAQAQTVEQGHVVGAATSAQTTARSRRNAVAVGALIGLILAAVAALVWPRRKR
jgi:uncharacterized protein involved in exopolysaccharide biosynthesis